MYIEKCITQSSKLFFSIPPSKNYLFLAYAILMRQRFCYNKNPLLRWNNTL